ncbi:unnamed protein product [Ilex paraguariensis]|uniref:Histone acetyltransferase n=1 Tax=Ilex paraguariensis TaxID=185542 RepID=A0ABC8RCK7_9AQUA
MPRPGPRPYECGRRAWHSDRHQPMRGSIIQQIFRVVRERHSTATKNNEEWQEKLPIVVLKAEEIMYSKANSEADYMDLVTLWDRVNDAINTIIRIDESMETGGLLPPCVEAALNLGCVPIRASRSQQQSNPRTYLNPRTQEPGCVPPRTWDNEMNEQNHTIGNQQTLSRRVSESNLNVMPDKYNRTVSHNFPSSAELFSHPAPNLFVPPETLTSLNVGSVYPLYYGPHFQPEVPWMGSQIAENLHPIIVGTPVFPSTAKPAEMGCLRNLFSYDGDADAANRATQVDIRDNHEKPTEMGCDLSLRLGTSLESCMSRGKGLGHEIDGGGPSSSQEEGKVGNLSPRQNKGFSFFPVDTTNDPFQINRRKLNFDVEGQTVEAAVRKRKVPFEANVEDRQFSGN